MKYSIVYIDNFPRYFFKLKNSIILLMFGSQTWYVRNLVKLEYWTILYCEGFYKNFLMDSIMTKNAIFQNPIMKKITRYTFLKISCLAI